jgi:hypothetical protein
MIASLRPVMPGLVLRATVLWILARTFWLATGAFASASVGDPADLLPGLEPAPRGLAAALALTPPAALLLAAVVTVLVLCDVRALRERAFLANLGVGLRSVAAVSFAVAVAWEAVVAVAV